VEVRSGNKPATDMKQREIVGRANMRLRKSRPSAEAGDIIDTLNIQFKLYHFSASLFAEPQTKPALGYPDPAAPAIAWNCTSALKFLVWCG